MSEEKVAVNAMNKCEKCIILDIDGTLIDSLSIQTYIEHKNEILRAPDYMNERDCIWKRMGMDQFIEFCFDNFRHVSLWTAASKEWAEIFVSNIIASKYRNKFAFVWCKERLSKKYQMCSFYDQNNFVHSYKSLKKVWKSKQRKANGWNKGNTLMIEDTQTNCVQNYGNAIYVKSCDVLKNTFNGDRTLFNLMQYLSVLNKMKNIRLIEKRNWVKMITILNGISDGDNDFMQYVLYRFLKHNVNSMIDIAQIVKSKRNLKEIEMNNDEYRLKLMQKLCNI